MFCSKCGKELSNSANFCDSCGFATANQSAAILLKANISSPSQDYLAIKAFEDGVAEVYTLSLFSVVFFFGIGIIFSIAVWSKVKTLFIPQVTTTNPIEIATLESSKKKLKTTLSLVNIPLYALIFTGILIINSIGGFGGILAFVIYETVLLLLMLLLGVPCTKHLKELYPKKDKKS